MYVSVDFETADHADEAGTSMRMCMHVCACAVRKESCMPTSMHLQSTDNE